MERAGRARLIVAVLDAPVHGDAPRRPDGRGSASWQWRAIKFGGPALVSCPRGYEHALVHWRSHGSTAEPASAARRPVCSPDTRAGRHSATRGSGLGGGALARSRIRPALSVGGRVPPKGSTRAVESPPDNRWHRPMKPRRTPGTTVASRTSPIRPRSRGCRGS